jgi:hypothetical protein
MNAGVRAAARLRVERLFSLVACGCRYLNLYRGLIDNKEKPVAQLIDPQETSAAVADGEAEGQYLVR